MMRRDPDPSLPGEIWKDIPGLKSWFQASSRGRVRRSVAAPACSSTYPGRVLAEKSKETYPRVTLSVDGVKHREMVHRLVGRTFLEPRPAGMHINHIDGDKHNNAPDNLEWVTQKENVHHAWRMGLSKPLQGEAHGMAKISEADVLTIRRAYDRGVQLNHIASVFGLSISHTSSIGKREAWPNIPEEKEAA